MTIGMWPGGERCHFCWLDDYISFWNKFVDIKEICVIYNLKCIYIILISLKICAILSILLIYFWGKKLGWWFTRNCHEIICLQTTSPPWNSPAYEEIAQLPTAHTTGHQTKRDYGPSHPILRCFNERNQWSLNYFSRQITITLHISYTLIIAKHTNL